MNSGFEDCTVLDEVVSADTTDWEAAFGRIEVQRKPNTDAIAQMALENFVEMRDSVANPHFVLRKKVGFALEQRFPERFIPRYSMVIFHPEIPYAEAQRLSVIQDGILDKLCANINDPEQLDWAAAEELVTALPLRA
jgi:kynurenine 3-monooxygenase